MPELTFFLNNTTIERFEKWLKDYTEKKSISQSWSLDQNTGKITRSDWGFGFAERVRTNSSATVIRIPGWVKVPNGSVPRIIATFSCLELGDRLQLRLEYRANPQMESFFAGLISDMSAAWPEVNNMISTRKSEGPETTQKGGRPGLETDDLVYRIAKAREGKEIYTKAREEGNPKTWAQVVVEINWRYGKDTRGVKLFEDARRRLAKLEEDDPEGILDLVKGYRGKET